MQIEVLNRLAEAVEHGSFSVYDEIQAYLAPRHEAASSPEPTDMDTIGTLIDKLATVSLKMWHNQETLYEIRRMTPVEFRERWGEKPDELHAVIKRCCDLNVQRADLMDAIDRFLRDAIADNEPDRLVRAQHKTY
jgi:hypothetical protein